MGERATSALRVLAIGQYGHQAVGPGRRRVDRDRDRQRQQEILATRWANARTRSPLSSWTIYARLANRVQITIDGHSAYLEAVEGAFGGDVDFAQLVKLYGQQAGGK